MNTEPLLAALSDVLSRLKEGILAALPDVLGAVVLFVFGLVLARLLKALTTRLLNSLGRRLPGAKTFRKLPPVRLDPSAVRLLGGLVYWIVVFLFLTASTELLGLPAMTTWLSGIANYLPRILTAALAVVGGFIGANLLRAGVTRAAMSVGLAYADLLGKLARLLVLLLAALIAIDLVGLDVSLLVNVMYIGLAALLFGAALAFGLGSRAIVANILAAHYVQKTYKVGHVVKIGALEGRIIQITPTALILQTPDEQVLVPADQFTITTSSLRPSEG